MNNNISCTSTDCKCELFKEIGICKHFWKENITNIYNLAITDNYIYFKLKEINLKQQKIFKPTIDIDCITDCDTPIFLSSNSLDFNFDNIIVDEIDRLNPEKCHLHSKNKDIDKTNAKCIGCRVGINENQV